MKKPKPTASSLRRKSGWVMTSSRSTRERIAPAMNVPRMTSSPNDSASAANPTKSTSAARTRIWAVVSWRRSRPSRMRRECSAPRTTRNTVAASAKSAASSSSVEPVPPSPEKDDRAEVRDRGRRDDQLPERGRDLARVLEHRDEHPERGGAEDDRDEQWRRDEPGCVKAERHDERHPEGEPEAEAREPQHLAAQLVELDLEAGEEEHEGEAQQRDDRDGRIAAHEPEQGRADDDARHNLEHDGGQLQAREQAEQERRAEGDGRDDEEVGEGGHAAWSGSGIGRYGDRNVDAGAGTVDA